MSTSTTFTDIESFTITHARKIASKVATDLLRFQTLYGSPSEEWIDAYEGEMVQLLNYDVVESVVYGFKRNGRWTEAAVRYRALPGGTLVTDDDPGKIRPRLDIEGAWFTSFLSYNSKWWKLSEQQRTAIKAQCPFQRSSGEAPPLESGYWADDLNYFAGGRGLGRSTVRR
jgi:Bacterial HORMA domain family 1